MVVGGQFGRFGKTRDQERRPQCRARRAREARKWSAGILPADVTASRAVTLVAETMLVALARSCAQSGRGNASLASVARLGSTHQGDGAGRRRISRQACPER